MGPPFYLARWMVERPGTRPPSLSRPVRRMTRVPTPTCRLDRSHVLRPPNASDLGPSTRRRRLHRCTTSLADDVVGRAERKPDRTAWLRTGSHMVIRNVPLPLALALRRPALYHQARAFAVVAPNQTGSGWPSTPGNLDRSGSPSLLLQARCYALSLAATRSPTRRHSRVPVDVSAEAPDGFGICEVRGRAHLQEAGVCPAGRCSAVGLSRRLPSGVSYATTAAGGIEIVSDGSMFCA